MARGRGTAFIASVLVASFVGSGAVATARTYTDRVGEVTPGSGPDITSVTVSNSPTKVRFTVRFATATPLRINAKKGWVDMLLVGIDVPPLGPPPVPRGDWLGLSFAAGTHGPSKTGVLVRLASGSSRRLGNLVVTTKGRTLAFSIPRATLGRPAWFAFNVAAGREGGSEPANDSGGDIAPATGLFRYTLTPDGP